MARLALDITGKCQLCARWRVGGRGNLPCEADTTSILLQVRVIQAPIAIHQPAVPADKWRANLLLHRERTRPGVVVLRLILILMVWLVLSVDLVLSIVEIVGSCHSRQSSGDFRSLSFARDWKPSVCIGCVQKALQLKYSGLQLVLAADTIVPEGGKNWIMDRRKFLGGRKSWKGRWSSYWEDRRGHNEGVACLGVVRLLIVNLRD